MCIRDSDWRAGGRAGSWRTDPDGGPGNSAPHDSAGAGRPVVPLFDDGRGTQARGADLQQGRQAAFLLCRMRSGRDDESARTVAQIAIDWRRLAKQQPTPSELGAGTLF